MRPVVFISSTIVDFRDLRSALKFWLEEFGYEVRISEEPGFPQAVDRAVLEAALAALEGIDYYILLIGERRGTIVQPDGISFTRAELRRARMLWQTKGRPAGLMTFVRENVETMVKSGGAPSVVDPAEWASVKEFLQEAKSETIAGVPHWVDTFASFRDIIDVLRTALRITGRLTRRALETSLAWETKNNLAELLTRYGGKPRSASDVLMAVPDVPPAESSDFGSKTAIPVHATEIMAWYYVLTVPRAGRILTASLDQALQSGEFLDFEPATSMPVIGAFQKLLLQLREQIEQFGLTANLLRPSENEDIAELLEAARAKREAHVRKYTVFAIHSHRANYDNVLALSRAVLRYLGGKDPDPKLPDIVLSPIPSEVAKISAERIADDEITTWLA